MKKFNIFIIFLLAIFLSINFSNFCNAKVLTGNINKEDFFKKSHIVVDGATGNPVSEAEISIPTEGIYTQTNDNGEFRLAASSFKKPAILSVNANGYKPFSLTLDENKISKPLIIVITKLFSNETVIDKELHHLGDNKFSSNSANSGDFNSKAEGSYFFKEFFIEKIDLKNDTVLKLGSIIGLDTEMAKKLGQSKVTISASSPVILYLNSKKIGEIKINGDNQEIPLPESILRANSYNTIRIETGINQESKNSIDYDDMEFMNLLLIIK